MSSDWIVRETDIPSVTTGMCFVPASKERIAVYFCNLTGVDFQYSSQPPTGSAQYGMRLPAGETEKIRYSKDGQLAREPLYAYQITTGQVHVVEVLYRGRTEDNQDVG